MLAKDMTLSAYTKFARMLIASITPAVVEAESDGNVNDKVYSSLVPVLAEVNMT